MFRDLREFMAETEKRVQLARIKKEVSLEYEVGAVCREICDQHGPAVLFENIKGHRIPLLCNLFGDYERIAAAFGTTPTDLNPEVAGRIDTEPGEPQLVSSGPVKEIIIRGNDVDLNALPVPVWNEGDGGPYITMGVLVVRKAGTYNLSLNRMQVHDRRQTGIAPYLPQFPDNAACIPAGSEPIEAAVVFGGSPAFILAAATQMVSPRDGMALASAYQGAPVELVPCETLDLRVPAGAELVIEGHILPGVSRPEGPCSELTGFMGSVAEGPVFQATAITHRKDPVLPGSYVGRPPTDLHTLLAFGHSPALYRALKGISPRVLDARITGESHCIQAIIKVRKVFQGPAREESKRLALAALGLFWHLQHCIIVEEEIDIYNPASVEWALATRVRPDRDIQIVSDCPNPPAHPAREKDREVGAKYFIDATRKYSDFPAMARPVTEIFQNIRSEEFTTR